MMGIDQCGRVLCRGNEGGIDHYLANNDEMLLKVRKIR